jgi:hypothetical protein
MSHSNYLIKNCSVGAGEGGCLKLWSELKPAFSDMVRHCDRCNKKVYVCETEEQIKFYTSVKFCIAVAVSEPLDKVVENPPLKFGITSCHRGNRDRPRYRDGQMSSFAERLAQDAVAMAARRLALRRYPFIPA